MLWKWLRDGVLLSEGGLISEGMALSEGVVLSAGVALSESGQPHVSSSSDTSLIGEP